MDDVPTTDLLTSFRNYVREENRWTLLLLGLIAGYVLVVPSLSFIPALDPYNEKRVLQIGLLLTVGVVLLAFTEPRRAWLTTFGRLPRFVRGGLAVVLGLGLLSSALAPAPFYAFLEVGHFALLFVAAGIVASEVRRTPRWTQRALLGVVAVSAGLYVVYFTVGYGAHLAVADIKPWPDGGTNYANIRFFNHYQTWTLPLLGGAILAVPSSWWVVRSILFGLTALWWTLIFASGAQGTLVAMAVAALGVGIVLRTRSATWNGLQGTAVFAGSLLFEFLFSGGSVGGGGASPLGEQLSGNSAYGRLDHWKICLDMAWAHPWLGAGPMHYAWPPFNFEPAASPHSAFMQWLAEWGVPSTGIMSGIAVWGGWRWIQQERRDVERAHEERENPAVAIALVASVLAGSAHAMVSGLLVAPLSQILLILVGGWAWGRYRHERSAATTPKTARAALCVLLVASMSVVGTGLRDLKTVKERRAAFTGAVERGYFSPRYWAQGYIGVRDSSVLERARRDR